MGNIPVWAEDKAEVQKTYPEAQAVQVGQAICISLPDGTYLSKPWGTEMMAWYDVKSQTLNKNETISQEGVTS